MTLVPLPGENFSAKCAESPRPSKRVVGKKRHHPNRKVKGKKQRGRNRHHFLLAKSRGGSMSINNLLWIDIEKHEAWHRLFKLATAEEVLELLTRVVRAKKAQ